MDRERQELSQGVPETVVVAVVVAVVVEEAATVVSVGCVVVVERIASVAGKMLSSAGTPPTFGAERFSAPMMWMPFGKRLLSHVAPVPAVEEGSEHTCVIFRVYFMSFLSAATAWRCCAGLSTTWSIMFILLCIGCRRWGLCVGCVCPACLVWLEARDLGDMWRFR